MPECSKLRLLCKLSGIARRMRLALLEEVSDMVEPFWKTVPFDEMTNAQWESLCDGCGKCCLVKLQDADTEEIFFTDVVCHLLDVETRKCTQYAKRRALVPTCVKLTPENLDELFYAAQLRLSTAG